MNRVSSEGEIDAALDVVQLGACPVARFQYSAFSSILRVIMWRNPVSS